MPASTPRKRWATSFPTLATERQLHPSKTRTYEYVATQARIVERLRSSTLMVWVDERDGRGWQRYERVNLRELAQLQEETDADAETGAEQRPASAS